MSEDKQLELFENNRDKDLASIDRLFRDVKRYRKCSEFKKKLEFYSNFPYLGVYNAELVSQQRPGARLVLTAKKWEEKYERKIKPNARPVIILMPFYPVEFLFDIADTIPMKGKKADSHEVIENIINSHKASCRHNLSYYTNRLDENIEKYGICYDSNLITGNEIRAQIAIDQSGTIKINMPRRHSVSHHSYFAIGVNWRAGEAEVLASVVHELGHLFCQHLTCPWWKERVSLTKETKEFEAEVVSYLVCERLGIMTGSAEYLAWYSDKNDKIPPISIEAVFRAVDIVQQIVSGYPDITSCLLYKKDKEFKSKVDKEKELIKKEIEREKAARQSF